MRSYLHPLSRWDRGIGRALLERGEESMREYGFRTGNPVGAGGKRTRRAPYRAAGWERDGPQRSTRSRATEVCELRYRKAL